MYAVQAPVLALRPQFEGEAWIEKPGVVGKTKIYSGTHLTEGDVITTGKGRVNIELADGSNISLGSGSSFSAGSAPGQSIYDLAKGKLSAFIKKVTDKEYKFKTPGVNVTVKGTEFALSYDPDTNTSSLDLHNGTVTVTSTANGETKELSTGQSLVIDQSGQSKATTLSEEKWGALTNEISISEPISKNTTGNITEEITGNTTKSTTGSSKPSSCPAAGFLILLALGYAVFSVIKK